MHYKLRPVHIFVHGNNEIELHDVIMYLIIRILYFIDGKPHPFRQLRCQPSQLHLTEHSM